MALPVLNGTSRRKRAMVVHPRPAGCAGTNAARVTAARALGVVIMQYERNVPAKYIEVRNERLMSVTE